MSEAPEEKAAPTTEEQQEKLDAMLKEQQEVPDGEETAETEALRLRIAEEAEVDEKAALVAQQLPQSREEAKAYLMELKVEELREIAAGIEIKIPFTARSKDAISDLIVAYYYDEVAPEAPEDELATESPEAVAATLPAKTAPGVNAEIHRLLNEQEGHAPTVRGFMDLSSQIKALLPLD